MSVKTILVAHRSAAVRDRFAAALAEARHASVMAGTAAALAAVTHESPAASIDLAIVDLALVSGDVARASRVSVSPRIGGPTSPASIGIAVRF